MIPFEIICVYPKKHQTFHIEIRKGWNWITVIKKDMLSTNKAKGYHFTKANGSWKYEDAYFKKYNRSTIHRAQNLLNLLERIIESKNNPNHIKQLYPNHI
ncbi:hypothetical protein ACFL56_00620 [Candidatus Margulisiibacteriota bacterium]